MVVGHCVVLVHAVLHCGTAVAVAVAVGVAVLVGVAVGVAVLVGVAVGVIVGVAVGSAIVNTKEQALGIHNPTVLSVPVCVQTSFGSGHKSRNLGLHDSPAAAG